VTDDVVEAKQQEKNDGHDCNDPDTCLFLLIPSRDVVLRPVAKDILMMVLPFAATTSSDPLLAAMHNA